MSIVQLLQAKAQLTKEQAHRVVEVLKEKYGGFTNKLENELNDVSHKSEEYRSRAKNTLQGFSTSATHYQGAAQESLENAQNRAKKYSNIGGTAVTAEHHSAEENEYVKGDNINNAYGQNHSQFANHNSDGVMDSEDDS